MNEFDTPTGEAVIEPPERHAFETLVASGELTFGKQILWGRLSTLFGEPYNPESWKWRGRYLSFVKLAKGSGFFITEDSMQQKGVRVRLREEVAEHVRTRENRKANDSLFTSLAVAAIPREGLKSEEVKALDHWEMKSAVVGATAKLLLRRRSLPDPRNTAKTINQILSMGGSQ